MHLYICDDHPLITKSIATLFNGHALFSKISSSSSKNELFTQIQWEVPDILILDINLKGVNMIEEVGQMKQVAPQMKILILTSYDSQSIMRKALKKGVHAYLNKNTDEGELLEAIYAMISNEIYVTTGKSRQFNQIDNFEMSQNLSEREKEVIQLLLEGNPNKKIADMMNISVTTVQTHRRNIYKKLNLQGIGELMSFAVQNKLY
jgi:DNA-binding NarL/FixJ family response regulator